MFGYLSGYFTLMLAVLIFAALACIFSSRAGILNIAVNGQMIFGALIFSAISFYLSKNQVLNNGTQFGIMLIAMAGSVLFSLLFGFLIITFKTDQIIAGTAINLLAAAIAFFMLNDPSVPGRVFLTNFTVIAIDTKYKIACVYIFLALIALACTFVFFRYTKKGIYFVSTGENHFAVDSTGFNVTMIRYIALIISGILASLAGSIYTFSSANSFRGNVEGLGFIALAILVFGQWRILFLGLGCVLFGFLYALANYLPQLDGVPQVVKTNVDLFKMIPFLFTILVMVAFYKVANQPKYEGVPFVRSER